MLVAAGDPASAAGTNIAISAAAAASGGARHAREGRVDASVVAWMVPPSMAGAVIGALTGHLVPTDALLAVIAVVLAWNGLDLIVPVPCAARAPAPPAPSRRLRLRDRRRRRCARSHPRHLADASTPGGGRPDARRAVGTNLVVGFFLGVAGFATYALRLEVDWACSASGSAGALPGAWLGARITGRIPELQLRRAIGAALLVIAALLAVEALVR